MRCTICCQCGRWYGPWYEEDMKCLGQWEWRPSEEWEVNPDEDKPVYNPCNHLRCKSCGEGECPLPSVGPRKVIRPAGEQTPKKFNRKKKKGKNRNRSSSAAKRSKGK